MKCVTAGCVLTSSGGDRKLLTELLTVIWSSLRVSDDVTGDSTRPPHPQSSSPRFSSKFRNQLQVFQLINNQITTDSCCRLKTDRTVPPTFPSAEWELKETLPSAEVIRVTGSLSAQVFEGKLRWNQLV